MKKYLLLVFFSFLVFRLHANIRLPNIISSNMVLQQQSTVKLWGWAAAAEKIVITTSWNNKQIQVTADGNATWQTEIQTPAAGGPYTITLQGENKMVLENVLIGEVWICSGQSNMEWDYNRGIKGAKEDVDKVGKLNIRFFKVPQTTSKTPQDNCGGSWTDCDNNSIKSFSAVGYFFGKYLNQDLNVPIGLISSNWGGTPAEVWTPADLVEKNATLKEAALKNTPAAWWPVTPGYAYNAMIAPLAKYNIAGTIWYQGESNRMAPHSYATLMETMITAWRKLWDKNLPFYYVQIAPFKYDTYSVGALVREAQTRNLSIKNTGMAVISDLITDTLNIHPLNKKDVGLRLANWALAEAYGINKTGYKSPVFKSFSVQGNKVLIEFDNAEGGLMMKGSSPRELYIAGDDHLFYAAKLKIERDKIIVSAAQVKNPVAVRYQFSNAGIGNLFSKAGLPVAPFRTDNWEMDCSKVK